MGVGYALETNLSGMTTNAEQYCITFELHMNDFMNTSKAIKKYKCNSYELHL
uniref:Uncharacterized protein n=1 Tax=Leclercia adecarboxylata TaxID=83655 RepID=A0A6H0A3Z0_9ENTR|nr:hypothetical protein [Leclercia adecarboxylata]